MKYLPQMISLFFISVAANGATKTRASCAEILLQVGAGTVFVAQNTTAVSSR